MPIYKAYGLFTAGGTPRSPVLLDLLGTTRVALATGGAAPDLTVAMTIVPLTEPGGTGGGTGVRVTLAPVPGRILTDLSVRIVLLPSLDPTDVVQAPTATGPVTPGDVDYVVLEYATTGSTPMPAGGVVLQVGQLSKLITVVEAGPPVDQRLDDGYVVEACTPGTVGPLKVTGGLVTGPMVVVPGTVVTADGAYGESAAFVRSIDLARVTATPPATATSPASATWVEVGAAPPLGSVGTRTHLKVTVRMPRVGSAPATAPTVAATPGPGGPLVAGDYEYAVAFVHPFLNETEPGPASPPVTVPEGGGATLTAIPEGAAPATDEPEKAVLKRRIYRRGPGSGDWVLVGELPGPAAPGAPSPLPTTFTDAGLPIDLGGGEAVAAGFLRPPSRLSIRYTADVPLELTGTVRLASRGLGPDGVDTYAGGVTPAPTEVLVVLDDRAGHRGDLRPALAPRARLTWRADGPTHALHLELPGIDTPAGRGVRGYGSGVPAAFGADWTLGGDVRTVVSARGDALAGPVAEPAPAPGTAGGPDAIGGLAVIMGPGSPVAGWPLGEATVGGEAVLRDTGAAGARIAVAARGLRWGTFTLGDGQTAPEHPSRIRAELLLGADSLPAPGRERSARFLLDRQTTAAPADDLRIWGRVGVLPDRLAFDLLRFPTGLPQTGTATNVALAGALQRVVAEYRDAAALRPSDGAPGRRIWASLARTGDPSAATAPVVKLALDDQDVHLDAPEAWAVQLAGTPAVATAPAATVHAELRVPSAPTLHVGAETRVEATPDGLWGRAAFTPAGLPVATRANPQVRGRRRPGAPTELEALTARVLGASAVRLQSTPSTRDAGGALVDPVAKEAATLELRAVRPNRSFRAELVEIDPLLQPAPRTAWRARIGVLPDVLEGELHSSDEQDGGLFFVRAATSEPITDGVVWGEPGHVRAPTDPRGTAAGIGNVAATIAHLPVSAEVVLFDGIPAAVAMRAEYADGQTLPRESPPSGAAKRGGARIRLGGPLQASDIRIASFAGDSAVCFDSDAGTSGFRSAWKELLVPILTVVEDPDADPSADPVEAKSIWYWTFESPPPGPPSADPPPGPCEEQPDGPDVTKGTAFRLGDGLLVDLLYREYELKDLSTRPFSRWDGFTPQTDVDGEAVGTWRFKQDLQMKGYRGEITILEDPSTFGALSNPHGDWEAGPGQWFLRARDKLELVWYTGDLFMGNTGDEDFDSYKLVGSNGLFQTLPQIYLVTWP